MQDKVIKSGGDADAMILDFLAEESSFGGVSVKWFLICFLARYGLENEVEASVHDLSLDLGFSKDLTSKSINALVRLGYIEKGRGDMGKGRPLGIYSATDHLVSCCSEKREPPACLAYLDHFLNSDLIFSSGRSGKIPASTKLLFSVLLYHADRHGIVKGVGSSSLCKMTGMSREQLRKQISRLMQYQLIRSVVKGCTGKYLFGCSGNQYFLNFRSPIFDAVVDPRRTIVFEYDGCELPSESFKIRALCQDAFRRNNIHHQSTKRGYKNSNKCHAFLVSELEQLLNTGNGFIFENQDGPNDGGDSGVIGKHVLPIRAWWKALKCCELTQAYCLLAVEREVMFSRLQLLIDESVGTLLSEAWDYLASERSNPDSASSAELAVFQKIDEDLFAPKALRGETEGFELSAEQRAHLVCFVFLVARQHARILHRFLVKSDMTALNEYDYAVLPPPKPYVTRYGYVLDAVPKRWHGGGREEFVFHVEHGVNVAGCAESIDQLSLKQKVRLSLLGRVKG